MLRWVIAGIAILGGISTPPAAAVSFEVLDVPHQSPWVQGALSGDGSQIALNAGGHYYLWTRGTGFTALGTGHPLATTVDISADGNAVCGTVIDSTGRRTAALWRSPGGWSPLATTGKAGPGVRDLGSGYAVDSEGSVVVGLIWIENGAAACRWSSASDPVRLPDSGRGSRATAVAQDGQVIVGFDEHPQSGFRRPARWIGGELDLVAGPDRIGEICAIDPAGQRYCGQVDGRAFLGDETRGLVDLGLLEDGPWDQSLASSLSATGVAVGWSGDPTWDLLDAFVWTEASGMQSLASWLARLGIALPEGLHLLNVMDISADGSTMIGIWQDPDWRQGTWLVSGLGPEAYALLVAPGAGTPAWQRQGLFPDGTPPPAPPGRPVRFR